MLESVDSNLSSVVLNLIKYDDDEELRLILGSLNGIGSLAIKIDNSKIIP